MTEILDAIRELTGTAPGEPLPIMQLSATGILVVLILTKAPPVINALANLFRRRNGKSKAGKLSPLAKEMQNHHAQCGLSRDRFEIIAAKLDGFDDHLDRLTTAGERQATAAEQNGACLTAIKDNTQATRDGVNRLAGQVGRP